MQLHFVHERSSDPNAIPLIFSHGWPGSFIEAFKMIRKLTDPGASPPAALPFASPKSSPRPSKVYGRQLRP